MLECIIHKVFDDDTDKTTMYMGADRGRNVSRDVCSVIDFLQFPTYFFDDSIDEAFFTEAIFIVKEELVDHVRKSIHDADFFTQ